VRQNDLMNEQIGILTSRNPKYPEYSTIESRIRTFSSWSSTNTQEPAILAQAGFYYLGIADEVRCFYCDGGLRNWLQSDDPWFEHTRWFPKCPFVTLVKGSTYIKVRYTSIFKTIILLFFYSSECITTYSEQWRKSSTNDHGFSTHSTNVN
jgi:hypothetical protein